MMLSLVKSRVECIYRSSCSKCTGDVCAIRSVPLGHLAWAGLNVSACKMKYIRQITCPHGRLPWGFWRGSLDIEGVLQAPFVARERSIQYECLFCIGLFVILVVLLRGRYTITGCMVMPLNGERGRYKTDQSFVCLRA